MRLTGSLLATGLILTLVLLGVSSRVNCAPQEAQGQEPVQPVPAPATEEAPPPKSDPAAVKLVEKAADRQGGDVLAEKDALNAVHVLFKSVTMVKDGNYVKADNEGFSIDWMAPDFIKTRLVVDGKQILRGVTTRFGREVPWLYEGNEVVRLSPEKHPKDIDQLSRDRRMVRALLDVAILRKLLTDGSVLQLSEETIPGGASGIQVAAVRRIPPTEGTEDGRSLTLVMWVNTKTHDVIGLRVEAARAGAATFEYRFYYNATFPDASVGGDKVRFPFEVNVYEVAPNGADSKQVLKAFVKTVKFNAESGVEDTTFNPPKSGR